MQAVAVGAQDIAAIDEVGHGHRIAMDTRRAAIVVENYAAYT